MKIDSENTIGLVIDMQEKLLPTIAQYNTVVKNTVFLLRGLNILQIPLFSTRQNTKGLGYTVSLIEKEIGACTCIEKTVFSCMEEPEFVKYVRSAAKKNIIIAGVEAHICLLQTAIDLVRYNFIPVIVEDCIGSLNENDKKVSLWRMRDEGSVITTSSSVLFELCGKSGTDEFKELLKMIKERKHA